MGTAFSADFSATVVRVDENLFTSLLKPKVSKVVNILPASPGKTDCKIHLHLTLRSGVECIDALVLPRFRYNERHQQQQ